MVDHQGVPPVYHILCRTAREVLVFALRLFVVVGKRAIRGAVEVEVEVEVVLMVMMMVAQQTAQIVVLVVAVVVEAAVERTVVDWQGAELAAVVLRLMWV